MEDAASRIIAGTEETLKTQDLLQSIMDNVPTMIAVMRGPEFVYEFANPAFQELACGRQMVGRRVADVWPDI
jgi:PAS domain-containing protein